MCLVETIPTVVLEFQLNLWSLWKLIVPLLTQSANRAASLNFYECLKRPIAALGRQHSTVVYRIYYVVWNININNIPDSRWFGLINSGWEYKYHKNSCQYPKWPIAALRRLGSTTVCSLQYDILISGCKLLLCTISNYRGATQSRTPSE